MRLNEEKARQQRMIAEAAQPTPQTIASTLTDQQIEKIEKIVPAEVIVLVRGAFVTSKGAQVANVGIFDGEAGVPFRFIDIEDDEDWLEMKNRVLTAMNQVMEDVETEREARKAPKDDTKG